MQIAPFQSGVTCPCQAGATKSPSPLRSLRRYSALLVAVAVAGSWAGLPSAAAVAAAAPSARAMSPAIATNSCHLPVATDTYDGFKIGVPSGWDVSSLQGLIGVTANATGSEGVLLYPALLTNGVTTQTLFSSFMSYEQHTLSKQGEALTYHERGGAEPTGSFQVRGGGTVLAGRARVLVLPMRTAVTTKVGVAVAYWAPQAQLSAAMPTLAEIGSCYQPERAALFQLFRNVGPFTFTMPSGWKVSGLNQDYIQLSGFGPAPEWTTSCGACSNKASTPPSRLLLPAPLSITCSISIGSRSPGSWPVMCCRNKRSRRAASRPRNTWSSSARLTANRRTDL